jgi:hypothetical protein
MVHEQVQVLHENDEEERCEEMEAEEDDGDVIMTDAGDRSPDKKLVDITHLLSTPQSQAAATLGIPVSTLSKRWKEAGKSRMWPYRNVIKIDAQITALLVSISEADVEAGVMPADVEERITALLKERAANLQPVSIRM